MKKLFLTTILSFLFVCNFASADILINTLSESSSTLRIFSSVSPSYIAIDKSNLDITYIDYIDLDFVFNATQDITLYVLDEANNELASSTISVTASDDGVQRFDFDLSISNTDSILWFKLYSSSSTWGDSRYNLFYDDVSFAFSRYDCDTGTSQNVCQAYSPLILLEGTADVFSCPTCPECDTCPYSYPYNTIYASTSYMYDSGVLTNTETKYILPFDSFFLPIMIFFFLFVVYFTAKKIRPV